MYGDAVVAVIIITINICIVHTGSTRRIVVKCAKIRQNFTFLSTTMLTMPPLPTKTTKTKTTPRTMDDEEKLKRRVIITIIIIIICFGISITRFVCVTPRLRTCIFEFAAAAPAKWCGLKYFATKSTIKVYAWKQRAYSTKMPTSSSSTANKNDNRKWHVTLKYDNHDDDGDGDDDAIEQLTKNARQTMAMWQSSSSSSSSSSTFVGPVLRSGCHQRKNLIIPKSE